MQHGAFDYVLKPWDLNELTNLVNQALEAGRLSHVRAVIDAPSDSNDRVDRVIGRCPAMQKRLQGDRPHRGAGCDRVDPRGRAAPAKSWSHGRSTTIAGGATSRSWRSIARRSLKRCWKASCSAMRRGPSPARNGCGIGKFEQAHRGNAVSRRDRRCGRDDTGQDSARASGRKVRASRRKRDHSRRRENHRRHQPGSRPGDATQRVPSRPFFPPETRLR
jgi:hypothetical protein